eukprot:8429360-Alexandrium_andersonii.AAC.1
MPVWERVLPFKNKHSLECGLEFCLAGSVVLAQVLLRRRWLDVGVRHGGGDGMLPGRRHPF